jgi:hypothetical protein
MIVVVADDRAHGRLLHDHRAGIVVIVFFFFFFVIIVVVVVVVVLVFVFILVVGTAPRRLVAVLPASDVVVLVVVVVLVLVVLFFLFVVEDILVIGRRARATADPVVAYFLGVIGRIVVLFFVLFVVAFFILVFDRLRSVVFILFLLTLGRRRPEGHSGDRLFDEITAHRRKILSQPHDGCVNSRGLLYACYKAAVRWTFVAVALALTAGRVQAQSTSYHLTLSGDIAATDNALSAPVGAEADIFFQLRPGLLFAYNGPRQMHELAADAEVLEYVRHSTEPTFTGRGTCRSIYLFSPLSELVTSVSAGTGRLNAITTATSPDLAAIGATPNGAIIERDASADEYGSHTLSPSWRIGEVMSAHYTGLIDDTPMAGSHTHSGAVSGSASGEYNWKSNALSIEAGVEYLYLERYAPLLPPGLDGSRLTRQLNPHALVSWRRDLSRYWSASISGGVKQVRPVGIDKYNPGDVEQTGIYPLLGAQVSYTDIWGRLTISGHRTLAPNLLIAQNTETTGGLVQLSLPLPFLDDSRRRDPKLFAQGTFGYEHTRLIETDLGATDMLAGAFDNFHVDVGIGYAPRPGFTYGLRYEFLHQTGSDSSTLAVISPFTRNTLFFTFALRYPDRVAVTIPKRQDSVRADRKDLPPIGEEVVVPDNPNEADR